MSPNEDTILLIELHTATVCWIKRGYDATTSINDLYRYLNESKIAYPKPETEMARVFWQSALVRATPEKCKQLLNIKPDLSNI